jgi:uncharacterized protein (UPF0335 family)
MTIEIMTDANKLKQYIERIEKLEDEKKEIVDVMKDVFEDAKANGFDVKTMRAILKMRKMKPHELEEQEALLDTYKQALGI